MFKKPIEAATCAIYDPADSSVQLVHTVVRIGAGKAPDQAAVEAEAREILATFKRDRPGLNALHVKEDALSSGGPYRIVRGQLTTIE